MAHFSAIFRYLLALLMLSAAAAEQTCPSGGNPDAPRPATLHGTLQYHDELRHWIGITLNSSVCGQREIQLVFPNDQKLRLAGTLNRCKVTVIGNIFESPTGYYSAPLAVGDPALTPDVTCHPAPLMSDPSTVPIPAGLSQYRASITVDYKGKGHVSVRVWGDGPTWDDLTPWQAYVSYMLTGGADIIRLECNKQFRVEDVALDGQSQSKILHDIPGSSGAILDTTRSNTISFTCGR